MTMLRQISTNDLMRALAYQDEMSPTRGGVETAQLHASIASAPMADIRTPELLRRALDAIAFIRGTGMANMPPDPKLTALLIDAMCFSNGFSNRDEAWRAIGVSPAVGPAK